MEKILKKSGITLIALVVTIIILVILAGVTIATLKNANLFDNAIKAKEKSDYEAAKEAIELKLSAINTDYEMHGNGETKLQFTADRLCEDDDIEYVNTEGKKQASIAKITLGENVTKIYTKLKKYKYEFGISENIKLATIDGKAVNENVEIAAISKSVPKADLYVATTGDDTTGDGSVYKPYASLSKAIDTATSGQKIYIEPGNYTLNLEFNWQSGYSAAGLGDNGKDLEIFGDNSNTILYFDCTNYSLRDCNAISLLNSNSRIRNLTYIFKPKSGSAWSKAIFGGFSGAVENCFFRIVGQNSSSWVYGQGGNSQNCKVKNCTFYHDLGTTDSYDARCRNFINIATNVNTDQINTNVIVKNFGDSTMTTQELIEKSKQDNDFIKNKAGVFFGDNAWK